MKALQAGRILRSAASCPTSTARRFSMPTLSDSAGCFGSRWTRPSWRRSRWRGAAAEQSVMRLGEEEIALVRFAPDGRPYRLIVKAATYGSSIWPSLCATWTQPTPTSPLIAAGSRSAGAGRSISRAPMASVRAFKFRDPDGHPLELIWFPPGHGRTVWHQRQSATPLLGIDHSGLAVSLASRSLAFYRRLGLAPSDAP